MRYLDVPAAATAVVADPPAGFVTVGETRASKLQNVIAAGRHRVLADEPVGVGGHDTGPGPYDFLLGALGACTSMTMRLYAERKSIPLDRVTVTLKHGRIYAKDCETCETQEGMISRIERTITMDGALDAEQRRKLMEIADKCPVHRTLTSEIDIVTKATDP
jgi:putative redox protein